MNKAVAEQLVRARTALYLDHPFFGVLALRLDLEESKTVKTLAVNHKCIRYNPDFIKSLSHSLTKSALAHEVMHIVFEHVGRRGTRDPVKWNCAGDYVINAELKGAGFELGPTWLYDTRFEGMTTDHVYDLLPDVLAEPLDEVDEAEDKADHEDLATEWKLAVTSAAKIAQGAGKLPKSLKRLADEYVGNVTNWPEQLRRFFTAHAKDDTSWTRPQRRMVPYGYILPGLYSEQLDTMAVVIDTSGSIDDYTLSRFAAEIMAIKNSARPKKLIVIYCDAAIAHIDKYDEYTPPTFAMHGGGGTDFRPPFAYLEREQITPSCLVYLTDGLCYSCYPRNPPPYPVMWAMTTAARLPWGEHLRIDV